LASLFMLRSGKKMPKPTRSTNISIRVVHSLHLATRLLFDYHRVWFFHFESRQLEAPNSTILRIRYEVPWISFTGLLFLQSRIVNS
jgi:hypothetical protein